MKKQTSLLMAAVFFLGGAVLHSQMAPPPKTPLQAIQSIKAANAELIEQQKKTLEVLDEMKKAAEQLKIMSKRT